MPIRRLALMLACLPIAACATAEGGVATGGSCKADGLARFAGQKASADTGAAILKASRAKTLRWGGPGMAMTMDFRPDRVTVSYDAAMTIIAAHCG